MSLPKYVAYLGQGMDNILYTCRVTEKDVRHFKISSFFKYIQHAGIFFFMKLCANSEFNVTS
jgi:hypothetical protein